MKNLFLRNSRHWPAGLWFSALLALAGLLPSAFALQGTAATPKTFAASAGLYGLLTTNIAATNTQVTTFLNHADFAGVSVRTYWRDIETAPGSFDWSTTIP